jgi:SAM-dependent methyltransferase
MPELPMSEKERWETRFRAPDYIFGKEPNAFLKAQAPRLPARGSTLSVADGEGRNGVWLAEQGLDVLTIDYSPAALAKARALAAERGVKLRTEVTDVFAWRRPTNSFDVIAAIFIFASPAERPAFFANLKSALKPGGLLLIQGYRPEQLKHRTGGPPNAERMYTRAILQEGFGDMAEIDIREHDGTISEGTAHVGMSALIDLVARK